MWWLFKVFEILILAQDMNSPKYLCMKRVFHPNFILFDNCCIKYFENSDVRELLQREQKQKERVDKEGLSTADTEGGEC